MLERQDMEKLGMGALLAVASASHEPPKLIVLRYHGAAKSKAPVALVGKGITFDTGGISLKPAGEMDEMKFDMSGAGSVLGTIRALAAMKAPVNVVGIIPDLREHAGRPRHQAGRHRHHACPGQTVEILNTDAEGRLILCDALTYAERFKPEAVIDIATLTGACVIALGHVATRPVRQRRRALADEVRAAADDAWDRVLAACRSGRTTRSSCARNFADFANIGGRPGGAITAACFLARFTRKHALGAPRHRRHRLAQRPRKGLDRPAGAAAGALRAARTPDGSDAASISTSTPNRAPSGRLPPRRQGIRPERKRMLIYAPDAGSAGAPRQADVDLASDGLPAALLGRATRSRRETPVLDRGRRGSRRHRDRCCSICRRQPAALRALRAPARGRRRR